MIPTKEEPKHAWSHPTWTLESLRQAIDERISGSLFAFGDPAFSRSEIGAEEKVNTYDVIIAAVVLSAIRKIVTATCGENTPVTFGFGTSSYADLDNKTLRIAEDYLHQFFKDQDRAKLTLLATGAALHEAAHFRFSSNVNMREIRAGLRPAYREVHAIATIVGLLEDRLIEKELLDTFPGFRMYLEARKPVLIEEWRDKFPINPRAGLKSYLDFAIVNTLCPNELAEEPWMADPELQAEREWLHAWAARYDRTNTTQLVNELLDHIVDLLEPPEPDPRPGPGRGGKDREKGSGSAESEEDRDRRRRTIARENSRYPSLQTPMDSTSDKRNVARSTAVVNRLAALDLDDPAVLEWDGESVPLIIARPADTDRALNEIPSLTRALARTIHFRRRQPNYVDRLRRSGKLSDEELWRAGAGDFRVYEEEVGEHTPQLSATLLVDLSGSMLGYASTRGSTKKIEVAMRTATSLAKALAQRPGIRLRVRAHSTLGYIGPVVYRIWETGEPFSRLATMSTLESADNGDGFAIAWCADELLKTAHPGEDLLLIVLSDGQPAMGISAGGGRTLSYGGSQAVKHVAEVVKRARQRGVSVIQVAIDDALYPSTQAAMFGPRGYIPYTNDEKLPRDLARIIAEHLG